MKKVSIVMPVYNHERFLKQALDSILMQEVNFDYELIVGEDCSRDNSRNILKEYENKFEGKMVVLYRDRNYGAIRNIKDLESRCVGEYQAYLEGDDYWTDKHKLQKQVDFLDENKDYVAITHETTIVDIKGERIRNFLNIKDNFDFTTKELESFLMSGHASSLLVRTKSLADLYSKYAHQVSKYKKVPGDRMIECLLLKAGKIRVLSETMSAYRYYVEQNGTNWTSKNEKHGIRFLYAPLHYYLIKKRVEKFSLSIDLRVNFTNTKMLEIKRCEIMRVYEGYNKFIVWIQELIILLNERQPVTFYKKYKKNKDILEF